uniref:L1 transposable element RRM domain-containing protein n=1 Tax=Pygocentrus nattereri TaxID=42514 RepID=A0A3B4E4Y6_PYGNA
MLQIRRIWKMLTLKVRLVQIREKIDDLENRSRRNLRIIGIPEGAEGSQPTLFMGTFFAELLGASNFPSSPEIERAHRAPAPKPQPGAQPRPMLVHFLSFQVKEEYLRLSRQQGQLLYKNSRVHIFPDLSADLRNRRNEFKSVKLKLHEAGLKFRMQYPAWLIFSVDGTAHKFDSAAEASSFLNTTVLPALNAVPGTASNLQV